VTSKDEPTDVQLDISKYEGHTPRPWEYNTDDDGWTLAFIRERNDPDRDEFIVLMTKPNGDPHLTMNTDLRLIAAAPDLLAEVKRLRKELEWYKQAINITADHIPRRAHWDAYVAEMVEKGLWPTEPED